jgi:hypothetical protein
MSTQFWLFAAVHERLINTMQGGQGEAAYMWTRVLCHMVKNPVVRQLPLFRK